jgi:hypothetical protein
MRMTMRRKNPPERRLRPDRSPHRLLWMILLSATGVWAATITGTIKDPQGHPIAGAVVSAVLKATPSVTLTAVATTPTSIVPPSGPPPQTGPSFLPAMSKKPSGTDGSFEIDNLSAGTFYLCASKADSDLLNPCWWSNTPTMVTAPAAGVSLVAAHGVTIALRVHDAQGLIAARPATDDVVIGTVRGTSPFIPARVIERDGTGKTLGLTAPPGAVVSLLVRSKNLSLNDDKGVALATGVGIPLTAPAVSAGSGPTGLPVPVLTVHVGGRKAQ